MESFMKNYCYLVVLSAGLLGCAGGVKEVACSGQNWAEFGYKMGSEESRCMNLMPTVQPVVAT